MKNWILLCAAASAPFTCSTAVFAQDAGIAEPAFILGDIVVTARAMAGRTGVFTSVDRMGADVAQRADVSHAYALVAQLPGVQLTEFHQGTTSGKFSLRGFNAEGTINAVKLLIDGIPSNSNDGNMPYVDMLFPLHIQNIEITRGTADPRFGLHAIAGTVEIVTRSGGDYIDMRASSGRFDSF